jgi:hypothetical protein
MERESRTRGLFVPLQLPLSPLRVLRVPPVAQMTPFR